jgi:hypothetical protein
MKTLTVLMLLASTLFAQSLEKKLAQYEESKLDKADALALSLFCPGAGLVYAGDNGGGLASFGVNLYLTYSFIDAVNKAEREKARTFGILMGIARAADIGFSLKAVDDYNKTLRLSVGLTANNFNGKTQPTLSLSFRF